MHACMRVCVAVRMCGWVCWPAGCQCCCCGALLQFLPQLRLHTISVQFTLFACASCQPPASLLLSTLSLCTPILLCVQAVYTTLREAEYRSTYPIAYWNVAPLRCAAASWRQLAGARQIVCWGVAWPAGLLRCAAVCHAGLRNAAWEVVCAPWIQICNPNPHCTLSCLPFLSSPAPVAPQVPGASPAAQPGGPQGHQQHPG